jgi:hypothetical protein
MIPHRDSPPGRRHFRLGPLGLIADTGEEFARIQSWLPQASLPTEHAPAAAVWISKLPPPKDVVGKPLFDSDGIAVWIDEHHERATAIGMTAHAEIDLREKSGRVHAGTDDAELEQLLTLTVRLLLGRVGCLLVDATAIVEPDGGAWMILGAPKARTALACGFVFDGCQFVSDGQLLLRRAHQEPERIVVESWHRMHASDGATRRPSRGARTLTPEVWCPLAPLKGVVVAHLEGEAAPRWERAKNHETFSAFALATPLLERDSGVVEYLHGLLTSCSQLPSVNAPVNPAQAPTEMDALKQLRNTVEEMLR